MSDLDRLRTFTARLTAARKADAAPLIMGVLNVTPDSFSDGGRFIGLDDALAAAGRMIAEGADIIDLGAESTRPGSDPVEPAEQIERAVPAIRGIRTRYRDVILSIDTRCADVAEAALNAGADLVNDVSALRGDPAMAKVIADRQVPVVLMHMRGQPKTMQSTDGRPKYDDVVAEVIAFLQERIDGADRLAISPRHIIVDPGLGFGKTVAHNLCLLRRLSEFNVLGVPVLVGASRKSFVGAITEVEVADQRLSGSLACVAAAVFGGAALLRVHDVAESRQAALMAHAIRSLDPAMNHRAILVGPYGAEVPPARSEGAPWPRTASTREQGSTNTDA